MKQNYLSFDLGASSGRAILGTLSDGKLSLREVHRFENNCVRSGNSLLWDYPALCREIRAGLAKAAAITRDIAAIGIDTWGVDYVLFNRESKEAVRLPYCYRDERTAQIADEVFTRVPRSEIYARTGIQFMPINTLYQLYVHQKTAPNELVGTQFLLMPDALELALGGDFTTEYTDASTTNLLDPVKRDWDWTLIDRLGLPRSIFPKIALPCSRGGVLSEALQKELGLGPVPIVKVGSHDTASAVAAVPAQPGGEWAYISCGTWALLGAEIARPVRTVESENVPFTNEGGIEGRIRFLTNIMGCWLFQECRRDLKKQGRELSFSAMSDLAETVPPFTRLIDPNHADFLAPGDMLSRIAAFCEKTGQTRPQSDAEILRCVYDSLSLCFADKLAALSRLLKVNYSALNIVGGGTQDKQLMQLTADAIGIPVFAGPIEATAIGNVLAQAICLGDVVDLDAARAIVRNSTAPNVYQPRHGCRADCVAALERFRAMAAAAAKA